MQPLFRRSMRIPWLALCVLAACRPSAAPAPPTAPLPGIELRIASYEPCLACEELPQRDPAAPVLYLKRRPLLTSADIEGIERKTDPFNATPALEFHFRPEAHARVQDVTAEHVGRPVAWVVRGQAFHVARIAGPFSRSMLLNGLEARDREELFGLLTGVKAPRQLRSATATPER